MIKGEWFTWGNNQSGQLGIKNMDKFTNEPQRINIENENIQSISTFSCSNIAITRMNNENNNLQEERNIYCWGENNEGELGVGHKEKVLIPTKIENLPSTISNFPSIHQIISFSCLNKQ